MKEVSQFDWREDGKRAFRLSLGGWLHTAPMEVRHNALVYLSSSPPKESWLAGLWRGIRGVCGQGSIHPRYAWLNARRDVRKEAQEVFSSVLSQVLD